jgi:hypothetical protein
MFFTPRPRANVLSFVTTLCVVIPPANALRLVTTTTLPDVAPAVAAAFLATPANWPNVVLSSQSVRGVADTDVTAPMQVGQSVDEIFGLPPILPLAVRWTCTAVEPGRLTFASPTGLDGVAKNCGMDFTITADGAGSSVELVMSYDATSPLATIAAPVLAADNALALRVLLSRAIGAS